MLSDYSRLLPNTDTLNPAAAEAAQASNVQALAQAESIFSMNAGFGAVLTAPQVMAAQRLAQTSGSVKLMRDNATGQTYQTVTVNGQPVVVGTVQQRPPEAAQPATSAPATRTNGTTDPPVNDMRNATRVPSVAMEPKGRAEFQQFQEAVRLGYQPAGRGYAMFGAGEVLYVNPKTGDRKYASQLFGK